MAEKVVFKMFLSIFFFVFISNASGSLTIDAGGNVHDKCNCFSVCCKNFTTNSVYDVPKITACQRGCRYYILDLHSSHELHRPKAMKNSKESCLKSCSEGYVDPSFRSACKLGCSTFDIPTEICKMMEEFTPQMSYSLLIEESDVLIHSGEPEPDDSLTDPGLRKQIQKTLVAMLEATPKLPDIRFKSLPVKTEKAAQASFKCPKFYGLDSNFEFRNGKIIIGDLYLFAGILIFVVLCFFLSHRGERGSLKRQLLDSRIAREDFVEKEPLLKVDIQPVEETFVEKSEILFPADIPDEIMYTEPCKAQINKIAFIFPNGDLGKENEPTEDFPNN